MHHAQQESFLGTIKNYILAMLGVGIADFGQIILYLVIMNMFYSVNCISGFLNNVRLKDRFFLLGSKKAY